jgi:hypothetical protein
MTRTLMPRRAWVSCSFAFGLVIGHAMPAAWRSLEVLLASRVVLVHYGQMTGRTRVSRWLAGCAAAWRAPGTGGLAEIFTDDAV